MSGDSSSSTTTQSNPATTNVDRRLALSGGAGVTGDNSSASTYEDNSRFEDNSRRTEVTDYSVNNSDAAIKYLAGQGSDTVKALANAGRSIIENSGGAIVDLSRFQGAQNTASFNTLVTAGVRLIDKMLDGVDAGNGLASKVVDSFTPVASKQEDSNKNLYIAAAVVAGAVLLTKGKA